MTAEIIILLAIREECRQLIALGRAQVPVVEEGLFPERSRAPPLHTCRSDSNPINATGFVGYESADLFETLPPKHLAATRNMGLALEALSGRAIPFFFEYGSRHTKRTILSELAQEKLAIFGIEGHIGIEVADHVISQFLHPFVAGVEGLHLGGKAAIAPQGHVNQLNPRIPIEVAAYDLGRLVGRSVIHDHPFHRRNGLANHRLD